MPIAGWRMKSNRAQRPSMELWTKTPWMDDQKGARLPLGWLAASDTLTLSPTCSSTKCHGRSLLSLRAAVPGTSKR